MNKLVKCFERIGSTVIVISLALLIASYFPMQVQTDSGVCATEPGLFSGIFRGTLSPQQSLHATVLVLNSTVSARFLVLEVDPNAFNNWINTHASHTISPDNATTLEDFVQSNPSTILFTQNGTRNIDYTYSPAEITSIVIVLSNPTTETVWFQCGTTVTNETISSLKAWLGVEVLLPIGLVAFIPRTIRLVRSKKQNPHR